MAFDPDLYLEKKAQEEFDPDAYLSGTKTTESDSMIVPAGYVAGSTGMKELGQAVYKSAQPFVSAVGEGLGKTAQVYKNNPILGPTVDVAGTALFGAPPIASAQSAMSIIDKTKAAKEAATIFGQQMSQGAPAELLNAKGELVTRPETVKPYFEMKQAATPEFAQKITEAYGSKTGGGGNNAVRALLNSQEGIAARYANPELARLADAYLKAVPTYGQQAMKVIAPFAKTAGKILGPIGTAFDLYEAGQLARETQLGERLQQGQGQRAEQAFRNMNTTYGAPISPQEAQNVLASGSQRDIQAFGGRDVLNQMIRKKAAERVLGPVAPR